ncbi:MAG: radical SAM protein [bacterium]|nr:radical SAM protein [bacterium]
MTYGASPKGIHFYPPLGLTFLAPALQQKGIEVEILDLGVQPFLTDQINQHIQEQDYRLVGISATTPQIHNAVRFARAIKEAFGDQVQVALGGYHLSTDETFIDRYPCFDFGVADEGEITFTNLAERVLAGEQVRGYFKGESLAKLDDMYWPAYDLTPMQTYREMGLDAYPIIGTKGCPYKCIFCSRTEAFHRVRYRSPESIIAEMDAHYEDFDGHFSFQDESFTISRSKTKEFCRAVLAWGRPIRWRAGGLRLDQVDEEALDLMWKAGCYSFFVGIESGSDRVRNEIIGKKLYNKSIFKAFKMLSKYGFEVEASFVLGHPGETAEEMRESCHFAVELRKAGFKNLTQIGLKPAVPMPGARLWDVAIEEGKIPADLVDQYINGDIGEDFWEVWPVYLPDGITLDQVHRLRKEGYFAYYLRPSYIAGRIWRDLTHPKWFWADFKELVSMLRFGRSTVSFSD